MQTRRILAAASFGFALIQLDVTIINVALPRLSVALHCGVAGLQWFVDAYAMAFAALLLSAGVLADRIGAAQVYAFGLWAFAGDRQRAAQRRGTLGGNGERGAQCRP